MAGLDRRALLARAGLGGAALAAAGAGPARAAAAGIPFPNAPRYRFVFVAADTTDPFYVATQYGAADASDLVGSRYEWTGSSRGDVTEMVAAIDREVARGVDGLAVALTGVAALEAPVRRALAGGVPVVGFDAKRTPGDVRLAAVGVDAAAAGRALAARIAAVAAGRRAILFASDPGAPRARAVAASLAAARVAHVLVAARLDGAVETWVAAHSRERALFALDRRTSRPLVRLVDEKRLGARVAVGAADMFPLTLEHVRDGSLAYTVDEEPYLQGFLPVQQLFLARFSGGLAAPVDVRIPLKLVTRASVGAYLKARTRFEGSSSRRAPAAS